MPESKPYKPPYAFSVHVGAKKLTFKDEGQIGELARRCISATIT